MTHEATVAIVEMHLGNPGVMVKHLHQLLLKFFIQ